MKRFAKAPTTRPLKKTKATGAKAPEDPAGVSGELISVSFLRQPIFCGLKAPSSEQLDSRFFSTATIDLQTLGLELNGTMEPFVVASFREGWGREVGALLGKDC